jgi:hypothetical protein
MKCATPFLLYPLFPPDVLIFIQDNGTRHTHTHNRCGAENKWLDAFASNFRVRRDATLFLSVAKVVSRYIPSFNKKKIIRRGFRRFFPVFRICC